MTQTYIQYGCGWSAPDGWRSYDASPTLRFERIPLLGRLYTRNDTRFPDAVLIGDILTGLPEKHKSAGGVYCSHILEHLALDDLRKALRNTHDLLKPGGVFRMVLPDMEFEARRYLDNPDADAVSQFMAATYLGKKQRRRGLSGLIAGAFGNSQHLWMWDYKGLSAELADAGFSDIRRAAVGDNPDPAFTAVEDPGRWFNSLGIECRCPA